MARGRSSLTPITKPGTHGTLYLFRVVYQDGDDFTNKWTKNTWGYDQDSVIERFYESNDGDSWKIVSIEKVRSTEPSR